MDQADKICTPCQGGIPPMSAAEVARRHTGIPQWEVLSEGTWLRRSYSFKNFRQSLEFVGAIGGESERQGHHPDICFGWGYVTVSLQTHKIGGLHENDFIMAARFDRIATSSAMTS